MNMGIYCQSLCVHIRRESASALVLVHVHVCVCERACSHVDAHECTCAYAGVMNMGMCVYEREHRSEACRWHLCVLVFMPRCLCMAMDGTQF